jgi:asparagine synthase (glutamine-hydrolysing)
MCGFAGIITKKVVTKEKLLLIGRQIEYRGPDSTGVELIQLPKYNVGLVHKRLSIIDLSDAGSQPMWNRGLSVCMLFNGEIYNFRELRNELKITHNVAFISDSDSEVILSLYDIYGISFLEKLIGMFSITILDVVKGKLFFIRDRVGVKPLYYGWNNGTLYFGSELKTFYGDEDFKPILSRDAIRGFMQYGYVPNHLCIYEGIKKVTPGCYVEYEIENAKATEITYWNISCSKSVNKIDDLGSAKRELVELFESAFGYRMVSDVPVGVFLSGGYDSTLLTAILSKKFNNLKTFTIGFLDKERDESIYAEKVAKYFGTDHHEFICGVDEALNYVDRLPFLYDEPFGDPSAIPTMMVSEKASNFVKVVLSADGGDEIFGGYKKHLWALKLFKIKNSFYSPIIKVGLKVVLSFPEELLNVLGLRNLRGRIDKIMQLIDQKDLVDILRTISQYIPDSEIDLWLKSGERNDGLFKNMMKSKSDLDNMLFCDIKTHLPDQIMTKLDRATMSASIEGREPLLDHRIIEKSFVLNDELKINKGKQSKFILKSLVWDMIPKRMVDRPKHGFGIPIISWMKGPLKPLIDELISEEALSDDIFNVPYILEFKDCFYSGKYVNERKLWHVLMFQLWYSEWVVKRKSI